jgi:hypothetical protein
MKFIPAFLSLGFFGVLAYFVWTDQIPYYLLPTDEADPNRLDRAEKLVEQGIGYLGALKTGAVLMGVGMILSLFFVMEPREKYDP